MMTFPYLKENTAVRASILMFHMKKRSLQSNMLQIKLKELKHFLEDITEKKITEEAVENAVTNSRKAAAHFKSQLALRKDHDPVTSLTNELYAIFYVSSAGGVGNIA